MAVDRPDSRTLVDRCLAPARVAQVAAAMVILISPETGGYSVVMGTVEPDAEWSRFLRELRVAISDAIMADGGLLIASGDLPTQPEAN